MKTHIQTVTRIPAAAILLVISSWSGNADSARREPAAPGGGLQGLMDCAQGQQRFSELREGREKEALFTVHNRPTVVGFNLNVAPQKNASNGDLMRPSVFFPGGMSQGDEGASAKRNYQMQLVGLNTDGMPNPRVLLNVGTYSRRECPPGQILRDDVSCFPTGRLVSVQTTMDARPTDRQVHAPDNTATRNVLAAYLNDLTGDYWSRYNKYSLALIAMDARNAELQKKIDAITAPRLDRNKKLGLEVDKIQAELDAVWADKTKSVAFDIDEDGSVSLATVLPADEESHEEYREDLDWDDPSLPAKFREVLPRVAALSQASARAYEKEQRMIDPLEKQKQNDARMPTQPEYLRAIRYCMEKLGNDPEPGIAALRETLKKQLNLFEGAERSLPRVIPNQNNSSSGAENP